jgi:DNA polymerase III delta' subunit
MIHMDTAFKSSARGQSTARRLLGRILTGDRLGHAYLLHGPAGVGKAALARDFARALACVGRTGCGDCPSCRRFDSGNYADFLTLETDEAHLKIEEVRGLIQSLSRKPVEGRGKIALITQADRLTPQAQNALLKTLEAPPTGAVLLLTTDSPESLLQTITSRCQLIACRALSREEITAALVDEGLDAEGAATAAERAEGSLTRARELAEDDQTLAAAAAIWEQVRAGRLPRVYAACGEVRDRESARRLLEETARLASNEDGDWSAAAAAELVRATRLVAANAHLQLTLETVLGGLTLSSSREG